MTAECKWCAGTGSIAVEIGSSAKYKCQDCRGTGRVETPDERDPADIACDDGEPEESSP